MPRLKKVVDKPAPPGPKWSEWIVPPAVHEKTWKSWTIRAAEAAARTTPTTTTSFSTLPLELRNKVYFYAIDKVPCLTLVGSTTASEDETSHSANDELPVDPGLTTWLSSLATHLPNHLNLNKQYRAEALAELHHSALLLVTHLRVPRAVDFLRLLPNARGNRNGNVCASRNASASATMLRIVDVTLTTPLSSSASSPLYTSSPTPCPTNQTYIHALSTLSPSLKSLTLPLSPAIMRDQSLYEPLLTPLVGANRALTSLRIEALGTHLEDAQRVERWVLGEGRKKRGERGGGGKDLRVVIDLAPGNDATWYEDSEVWTGGVRWVHSSDFFG